MLTRCPHCQTTFRVTTEQLRVRQGRVRCGACQSVFDALDSLTDELAVISPPEPEAESRLPLDGEPVPDDGEPGSEAETELDSQPEPEPQPQPEPEAEPELEQGQEPTTHAEVTETPPPHTVTEDDEAPLPEEWTFAAPPPRRWPWVLGTLLLLALGGAQLLYHFRVELAVVAPELRPALVSACELLGCTVPRPRKPELAGIESSDLVPAGGDGLLLTATLKNRAPFAQEYPYLELTLTDTRDEALLRKVLAPADWLPAGQDAAAGFPARGEVAVRLLLEAPGVPAVGYRLYLFYP
jgi:predicted Zn finger-like uncharacterized protein